MRPYLKHKQKQNALEAQLRWDSTCLAWRKKKERGGGGKVEEEEKEEQEEEEEEEGKLG
jgi:hypothetical protein